MARGYNRAVLMGNLAKDPDIRQANGQKKASITVAIGRQWKDKTTGEMKSHTDFINVVAWGFLADLCERYTQKGKPVLVEGRMSARDFIDKATGQKRWITEVVADNIVLLGSNKDNDGGYAQREQKPGVPGDMGYSQPAHEDEFPLDFSGVGGDGDEVDIPF